MGAVATSDLVEENLTETSGDVFGVGKVTRSGYEYGIPLGGLDSPDKARAHGSQRRTMMDELFELYLACPWVSTCADTVGRLVTAGGVVIVPDDGDEKKVRPPEIQQLDAILKRANDREDGVQLLRSTVVDLEVFGDGFLELGWIANHLAAVWTLDSTTMTVGADEHGELAGYFQDVDNGRRASFDDDEVIHISLDSPRGGIYGVSPTSKLKVTIVTWLFAAACLKEYYRKGMPSQLAIDLGEDGAGKEERFRQQYIRKVHGPRNIGNPVITTTGTAEGSMQPPVKELSQNQIEWLIKTLNDCRDIIISGFGLSPASVGVIESGNLGGGTGDAQAKKDHYGLTLPIQNILLEKLNFALLTGRNIQGWHFEFGEVDYRDSKTIEDIRDQRVRNGSWVLNKYRAEIGEDPVEGGDAAVLVDRQNLVLWSDMAAFSKANVDSKDPAKKPAPVLMAPGKPGGQPDLTDQTDSPQMPGTDGKSDQPAQESLSEAFRSVRQTPLWGDVWEQMRRKLDQVA